MNLVAEPPIQPAVDLAFGLTCIIRGVYAGRVPASPVRDPKRRNEDLKLLWAGLSKTTILPSPLLYCL